MGVVATMLQRCNINVLLTVLQCCSSVAALLRYRFMLTSVFNMPVFCVVLCRDELFSYMGTINDRINCIIGNNVAAGNAGTQPGTRGDSILRFKETWLNEK